MNSVVFDLVMLTLEQIDFLLLSLKMMPKEENAKRHQLVWEYLRGK